MSIAAVARIRTSRRCVITAEIASEPWNRLKPPLPDWSTGTEPSTAPPCEVAGRSRLGQLAPPLPITARSASPSGSDPLAARLSWKPRRTATGAVAADPAGSPRDSR